MSFQPSNKINRSVLAGGFPADSGEVLPSATYEGGPPSRAPTFTVPSTSDEIILNDLPAFPTDSRADLVQAFSGESGLRGDMVIEVDGDPDIRGLGLGLTFDSTLYEQYSLEERATSCYKFLLDYHLNSTNPSGKDLSESLNLYAHLIRVIRKYEFKLDASKHIAIRGLDEVKYLMSTLSRSFKIANFFPLLLSVRREGGVYRSKSYELDFKYAPYVVEIRNAKSTFNSLDKLNARYSKLATEDDVKRYIAEVTTVLYFCAITLCNKAEKVPQYTVTNMHFFSSHVAAWRSIADPVSQFLKVFYDCVEMSKFPMYNQFALSNFFKALFTKGVCRNFAQYLEQLKLAREIRLKTLLDSPLFKHFNAFSECAFVYTPKVGITPPLTVVDKGVPVFGDVKNLLDGTFKIIKQSRRLVFMYFGVPSKGPNRQSTAFKLWAQRSGFAFFWGDKNASGKHCVDISDTNSVKSFMEVNGITYAQDLIFCHADTWDDDKSNTDKDVAQINASVMLLMNLGCVYVSFKANITHTYRLHGNFKVLTNEDNNIFASNLYHNGEIVARVAYNPKMSATTVYDLPVTYFDTYIAKMQLANATRGVVPVHAIGKIVDNAIPSYVATADGMDGDVDLESTEAFKFDYRIFEDPLPEALTTYVDATNRFAFLYKNEGYYHIGTSGKVLDYNAVADLFSVIYDKTAKAFTGGNITRSKASQVATLNCIEPKAVFVHNWVPFEAESNAVIQVCEVIGDTFRNISISAASNPTIKKGDYVEHRGGDVYVLSKAREVVVAPVPVSNAESAAIMSQLAAQNKEALK